MPQRHGGESATEPWRKAMSIRHGATETPRSPSTGHRDTEARRSNIQSPPSHRDTEMHHRSATESPRHRDALDQSQDRGHRDTKKTTNSPRSELDQFTR